MERKLQCPKLITPEGIREKFEEAGYRTVSDKSVSIEVYDLLVPLLTILEYVQWWGEFCKINRIETGIKADGKEFIGVAVNAADAKQHVVIVPCNSPEAALDMPNAWFRALREYGSDVALRAERVDDTSLTGTVNEFLDSYGEILLSLLSLVISPEAMRQK